MYIHIYSYTITSVNYLLTFTIEQQAVSRHGRRKFIVCLVCGESKDSLYVHKELEKCKVCYKKEQTIQATPTTNNIITSG